MKDRKPKIILYTSMLFMSALSLAFIVNVFTRYDALRILIEAAIFYIIIIFVISNKSIRRFLLNLPRPHLIVLMSMFFCCLFAQYIHREKTTFPFVAWDMFAYSRSHDQVITYKIVGIREDGKEVKINPVKLFPSLAHNRIRGGIIRRLNAIVNKKGHPRVQKKQNREVPITRKITKKWGLVMKKKQPKLYSGINKIFSRDYPLDNLKQVEEHLGEYITAIGKMYNRVHTKASIERIDIKLCTKELHSEEKDETICDVNWQYEIKEAVINETHS